MRYNILLPKLNSLKEISIPLLGSKSISNRYLILQYLAGNKRLEILGLSKSDDTIGLVKQLHRLRKGEKVLDAGPAGTTFRFLMALLTLQSGEQFLTGSDRLIQRPIEPLIQALISIGAVVRSGELNGKSGWFIGQSEWDTSKVLSVHVDSSMSSQFASAMLLIGAWLPQGLIVNLGTEVASRSYLEMTIAVLNNCGINTKITNGRSMIRVFSYLPMEKSVSVESDWSAAGYFYGMISRMPMGSCIKLRGLELDSLQGDNKIVKFATQWGITSEEDKDGILIKRVEEKVPGIVEMDFSNSPDLAPTILVMCAASGVQGVFTGLDILEYKESNRLVAMQNELAKVSYVLAKLPSKFHSKNTAVSYYLLDGTLNLPKDLEIMTYDDHRMAMAWAIIGLDAKIKIQNPEVVSKSYPTFWEDVSMLIQIKSSI